MVNTVILKRNKEIENYTRAKLFKSIQNACLSVHAAAGEAEVTAQNVVKKVEKWLSQKDEVTSADIRRKATEALVAYNAEAAYMYKHKRALA